MVPSRMVNMGSYKKIYLVFFLILITKISYSQKVYITEYKHQADWTIYITDHKHLADDLVYQVKYPNEVGNGRIYITEYKHQADIKIYFVDYKHQADRVWNYVDYRHQTKMTETPK